MNSMEKISSCTDPGNLHYSPTLSRGIFGYDYELPEKSPKKEKKWSIGSLFRRKKRDEADSTMEEDVPEKGFLTRKKRKPEKKKKPIKHTFDHVVVSRNSRTNRNGYTNAEAEILSDPSSGFSGLGVPKSLELPRKSRGHRDSSDIGSESVDSLSQITKKELTKYRAEARRTILKKDSSSDEDSQQSTSTQKYRSDESLQREGSFTRRSRAARTERYLRRHSRDGEHTKDYLRVSKSDVENFKLHGRTSDDNSNRSLSRSPLMPKIALKTSHSSLSSQSPSVSGLSTIPPSHNNHHKLRVINSTSNPSYKPPLSINEYNYSTRKSPNQFINQRSLSCDANINKSYSEHEIKTHIPNNRYRNLSLIDPKHLNSIRQPPPPPPRDPRRLVSTHYSERGKPTNYYFDSTGQMRSRSFNSSHVHESRNKIGLNTNFRSTSEDNLPRNFMPRYSAIPDHKIEPKPSVENYNYLADKKPRSRRPIFIRTNKSVDPHTERAPDFWKRKEKEWYGHEAKPNKKQETSPQMFTSQTHVQTQVFLPSVLQVDLNSDSLANANDNHRAVSPFKPILPKSKEEKEKEVCENDELRHKAANLEEALDDLEAIYNSLHLGDEDLLERAEEREKAAVEEQRKNSKYAAYSNVGMSRGAWSDSGFSYEPFDSVDSPRRRRFLTKSVAVDRGADDMAFRKLHKEKSNTKDPHSALSRLSYMSVSPVYCKDDSRNSYMKNENPTEPDITLDDVVYRNVKYANNSPKVVDPQPPFGIPLAPIAVAANSDYLHAKLDEIYRPTFKPRKYPDLVKDDLAFRNLRKDQNKEPVLPSSDDVTNNNASEGALDLNSLKRRRAIRSLSTNIGSLIGRDVLERGFEDYANLNKDNEFSNLSDIADAMEIARQVLKDKEIKMNATRRGFLSDTDTSNANYDNLRESRTNFLNSLKCSGNYLHSKPPRAATPDRKSPLSKESQDNDLLATDAEKAKDIRKTELSQQLADIDSVCEKVKQCGNLLEVAVGSTDLIAEEVQHINNEPPLLESKANVVLTRDESKITQTKIEDANAQSDHDYENLKSDEDLKLEELSDVDVKCTSPFDEQRAELIASFQELKNNVDRDLAELHSEAKKNRKEDTDSNNDEENKGFSRQSRCRLPRWLRSYTCGNIQTSTMSEHQDGKAERIAQYKEERRKQLKCQLYANSDSSIIAARHSKHTNSSSSEGPRTTRASRLRAAAASQESASSPSQENKLKSQEKTLISPTSTPNLGGSSGSRYAARDKSNKRKSNLNRSLNCEEIPGSDAEDSKSRRRRRRFFPPELLEQATNNNSSNEDHNKSASFIHRSNTPPTTHSPISTHITAPRKSELSIHMENARKGITPSYSEMGKHKSIVKRAKESSHTENKKSTIVHNSETTKHHTLETQPITANNGIAKKLEELTALTKSTLARVEKLASKNKESPKLLKKFDSKSLDKSVPTSSILKKNVSGSLVSEYVPNTTTPVSILKRKVSQDEHKLESMSSMPTPPVTFSPSVVEPAITKRKQGILKKRRSLDESQVMRHRSCSPTVANKPEDSRSILKNQRRSSLEELTVLQSPELHLHSILKRKSLKSEEDDSLCSPQGILKRRSGSSSAGSTCASSHVSITTAVILAAASGAEMVLDPEAVRPILKKKYLSEDHSISENSSEAPRPILKKKSSTDTDDDERPKKTILKFSRGSIDYDKSDFNGDKQNIPTNDDVQRILKQTSFKEESVKPKLHFSSERNDKNEEVVLRHKHERRTNLVSAGFSAHESIEVKEEDRELTKPRPLSVFDLVRNFENFSTGAIPKRIHSKRASDRYKTQPVTSNELEASLHFVNAQLDAIPKFATHSSLDNESNLASFVCSGRNSDRGVSGKMSSDSAFQSLGDGLELEQEVALVPKKLEASKLELQMRAIALEAQNKKLGQAKYSRKSGVQDKRPSRFSTQPVTSQEVKKASGISESTEEKDEASIDDRRGILKSSASSRPRSSLKKRDGVDDIDNTSHQSILRTGAPEDEGISCNDSASDTEIFGAATSKVARAQNRKIASKLEQKSGDTTSEGESSGGREITNIFNSEKKLKVKQALESALFKSNSQSTFRNEKEPVNTKVTIRRSHTHSTMPQKIAELQAKLQKTGETGWKSRVQLNNTSNNELKLLKDTHHNNNELSLSSKKDDLDAASKQWKCRVEKSDADNFSVAGRMEKNRDGDRLLLNIPSGDSAKKTPEARRFKGKLQGTDSSSTPVSPDKAKSSSLIRSQSVPDPNRDPPELEKTGRKVAVTRPDDFTFTNFYTRLEVTESSQQLQLTLDDLDTVPRQSLLIQRKNVQAQKRRGATKNPVKALASRPDVMDEYTEVITGVAEKAKRKLNLEKLSKGSNLAIEALAGLASTEDFTSVALKKSSFSQSMVPFKPIMLLQVKGRRHVQTRLVEPIPSSINEGDCFILVTANCIYNYTGEYSNVIEQSRASDIVNSIQQTSDLGCKAVKTINLDKNSPITEKFWSSLGSEESIVDGGHPDEDEIYETNIIATNMIYHMDGDELVPFDGYWGSIPKFEILQGDAVLVFDFGSEMYVWSGKTAQISKKRMVLKLAKDLWDEGYDYSECTVCPLNVASILGNRSSEKAPLKSTKRPDWALFAKITQHRETILFKEKFLDWPDFSRIIRVKSIDSDKSPSSPNISPCDVKEMLKVKENEPDLIVEGHHLGRGDSYTDEETRRIFQFDTLDTKKWRILVNQPEELFDTSLGHFYDADSYIVKWNYKMTVKGRELNGKPSKHIQAGRDRCIYFCWQGCNSSINEKGFAALLTVELDSENSPQIRVVEGAEPAAFLRLFNGSMVIHSGKRDKSADLDKARLFILKGEHECEVFLTEVPCENQSLRSRTSFLLIDSQSARIIIWHGCKSDTQKKKLAKSIANNIVKKKEAEFYLEDAGCVEVTEVNEGTESEEFFDLIGKERVYFSLVNSDLQYNYTLRLFSLSSISGTFEATELLCPYRCGNSSPYPFLQQDLYSSSQPALFLIDNYHELWLWQGWWPEREEEVDLSDQAGAIRWHSERKAAMQTAINYWQKNHADEKVQVFLVWAGLEPKEFKNLFPSWIDKEDIAELNEKEKCKAIERVSAVTELARLSRTTYPLQELMERPLPDGVDPTHLEIYLSPDDFREILELTKEEFQKLPSWKQTAIKKEKGLF